MPTFFEKLDQRAKIINSLLCVGLDPHPEDLPEQTGQAAKDFCMRLIETTSEFALAFKPNAAFFEVLFLPPPAPMPVQRSRCWVLTPSP